MPIFLLPLIGGALVGGGAVWELSDTSKKLTDMLVLGAIGYIAYKKLKGGK